MFALKCHHKWFLFSKKNVDKTFLKLPVHLIYVQLLDQLMTAFSLQVKKTVFRMPWNYRKIIQFRNSKPLK